MKVSISTISIIFFKLATQSWAEKIPNSHVNEGLVSVMEITRIEQDSNVHIYDYFLKSEYKNLPLPVWLNSWEDILPNTIGEEKYDVKVHANADQKDIAQMLLFSLGSGFHIKSWDSDSIQKQFKSEHLNSLMGELWETGDISNEALNSYVATENESQYSSLAKRGYHIFETGEFCWIYDDSNMARVSALQNLKKHFADYHGIIIKVRRPAICTNHEQWRGCLSWSGGCRSIDSNVGAHTVSSCIGNSPDDSWISARSTGSFHVNYYYRNYWQVSKHNCCVSNRPNGCK